MAFASNYNAILIDGCKPLHDLRVDLAVSEDLITYEDKGFSLQLNAYPPTGQLSQGVALNWMQYVLWISNQTASWEIQYWALNNPTWPPGTSPVPGTSPWLPVFPNTGAFASFGSVPSNRIPRGSVITIALTTDSSANVVNVEFSINNPGGSNLSDSFPCLPGTQYPISGFEVNLVGGDTLATATFTSGAGQFKYSVSSGTLTPQNGGPGAACCQYAGAYTGELSNATYGAVTPSSDSSVSQTLSYSFVGTAASVGGGLNGYVGDDSSQHVNFLDIDGHVRELYIAPGAGWVDNDLTQAANGTPAAPRSALSGYWYSGDTQYVYFLDALRHVHELSITPGGSWSDTDLTQLTGGTPAAENSALIAYLGYVSGGRYVNFIDSNGHVHEISSLPSVQPSGFSTVDNDLTEVSNGTPAMPTSGLGAYWDVSGFRDTQSLLHVNFIDMNGHVHELLNQSLGVWIDNDLTEGANGAPAYIPRLQRPGQSPAVVARSSVSSYWVSETYTAHVNFIDVDGHVHELSIPSGATGWVDTDLTAWTQSASAAPGSALRSYDAGDRGQHVNFIDVNGHVHELTTGDSVESWVQNDLINVTGGSTAALSSALSSYVDSDGALHVNFIATDGHVHELYGVRAGGWVDNDLTGETQ